MRRTGVFARLTMLMSPVLHGQKAASNVDLSCVDSLELPTRDLFAARAGSSGVVHAVAPTGKDGKLSNLRLRWTSGSPSLSRIRPIQSLSLASASSRHIGSSWSFARSSQTTTLHHPEMFQNSRSL